MYASKFKGATLIQIYDLDTYRRLWIFLMLCINNECTISLGHNITPREL